MRRHEPDLNVDKYEFEKRELIQAGGDGDLVILELGVLDHELTPRQSPPVHVEASCWTRGFPVLWVRLACGRVHFSEVSDPGSMGHFVDLGEI